MFWRRDYPTDEEVAESLEGIDIVEAADLAIVIGEMDLLMEKTKNARKSLNEKLLKFNRALKKEATARKKKERRFHKIEQQLQQPLCPKEF